MSPAPLPVPCSLWHHRPAVHDLLRDLAAQDVRLVLVRGGPGPDRLAWHPDSGHGAQTFAALETLRRNALAPAFVLARDNGLRAAALAAAQRAPTVASAVAARFGDPDRWLGFGPVEATRRFKANWT